MSSFNTRVAKLRRATGLRRQRAIQILRDLGTRPAALRHKNGWSIHQCDLFLYDPLLDWELQEATRHHKEGSRHIGEVVLSQEGRLRTDSWTKLSEVMAAWQGRFDQLYEAMAAPQRSADRLSEVVAAQQRKFDQLSEVMAAPQRSADRLREVMAAQQRKFDQLHEVMAASQRGADRLSEVMAAQQRGSISGVRPWPLRSGAPTGLSEAMGAQENAPKP